MTLEDKVLMKKSATALNTLNNLTEVLAKQNSRLLDRVTHLIELLTRIKDTYPHIFSECITTEDIERILDGYKAK